MTKALFAGSFNPLTLGHLDIIERAAPLFDSLLLGVAINLEKSQALFSPQEILEMLKSATSHLPNVEVASFVGLTVSFAKQKGANVLIRALRSFGDYEWEMSLSLANRKMSGLETLVIFGDPQFAHISSKLVREIAAMKGNLKDFVSPDIELKIQAKLYR
jgi:pantetheine-phosphate adenylyltransferase